MIEPSIAERATIVADCGKRFPGRRAVLVRMTDPIDACVVVASFDLRSYLTQVDAERASAGSAQRNAAIDRLLWCSPADPAAPTVDTLAATNDDPQPQRRVALERLDALCEVWPAAPSFVVGELELAAGLVADKPRVVPLTPGTAPPGLSPTDALALLAGAPTRGPGALWAVTQSNGLALVLAAPLPDVWLAAGAARDAAETAPARFAVLLPFLRSAVRWEPELLDGTIERIPFVTLRLPGAYFAMGGSAAAASSSFL